MSDLPEKGMFGVGLGLGGLWWDEVERGLKWLSCVRGNGDGG